MLFATITWPEVASWALNVFLPAIAYALTRAVMGKRVTVLTDVVQAIVKGVEQASGEQDTQFVKRNISQVATDLGVKDKVDKVVDQVKATAEAEKKDQP